VAAFADFARLLSFRSTSGSTTPPPSGPSSPRRSTGGLRWGWLCLLAWATLLVLAWRRGRRVEAFGLGWIGVALSPVANLLYPAGVLVAERTLYLPSVGLALAAGAALGRGGAGSGAAAARVGARARGGGWGVRTALRVPVWRDELTVVLSELEDSPRSFDGPARMVGIYLSQHKPRQAFEAFSNRRADLQPAAVAFHGGRGMWRSTLAARVSPTRCWRDSSSCAASASFTIGLRRGGAGPGGQRSGGLAARAAHLVRAGDGAAVKACWSAG